ncbi:glutamic-type intramembrane protease PrsW [Metabacillus sediminilitoris]|jgi:RsiW-degrading membrane proteinase PrsW (M82 family)|uniref:Protease PrsW n=1 Tax=Metabacillus sediminilitoris TaxID=2567941 RepID=A0A4S4C4Z5_9BACI|nr:glutamic-type intramembrane protease PrsW [Metabacillus sediminilitoris]QGQ46717.1 intramembrane metalloprotease PrsW [Metabacillus sediminilitoris]THF82867.1 intramembrane metalloprotease PrsW [Metabacillus sediminilitoris]
MIAIISAGIAPGLALLSYFYLKDQYDTEPFYMVLRSFIFGALLVFPIMFIQYVLDVETVFSSKIMYTFVAVGFLEEFFKWFILFFTIYQHVHFDEHYDGIVYGVSVSLGFATLENIIYLFANGLEHAFGRAILPVSSHALFGVIMGYYLGKGKFSGGDEQKKWLLFSSLLPIFLHTIYDSILISYVNWRYIMVPFMLFLWWFALHKAKKARVNIIDSKLP